MAEKSKEERKRQYQKQIADMHRQILDLDVDTVVVSQSEILNRLPGLVAAEASAVDEEVHSLCLTSRRQPRSFAKRAHHLLDWICWLAPEERLVTLR